MLTELLEKLDQLERHNGTSAAVLSVYINMGPGGETRSVTARLKNLLEPIAAATGDVDHDVRMARRKAIERVFELEPRIANMAGRCVAVFVNGNKDFEEIVALPGRAWDVAVADSQPYLRPYLATLDAVHTVATVVVDPRRSEILVTRMGETLDHAVETAEPIRKADFGGWHGLDEHRSRNRTDEQHARMFKAVARQLSTLHDVHRLEAIFVGGRDETVGALLVQLPEAIRSLVADTFHIDIHTATPATIASVRAGLEDQLENRLQQERVASILESARAGGLAVVGLSDTLMASNLAAVEHLVVAGSEMEPGWICGTCGWLALSGPACRGCGAESSAVADVIELLVSAARAQKAGVEHVLAPSELGQHLVAARIRFHTLVTTSGHPGSDGG